MKKILFILAPAVAILAVLISAMIANTYLNAPPVPLSEERETTLTLSPTTTSQAILSPPIPTSTTPNLERIPITYTVKTVSGDTALFTGIDGEMTVKNSSNIQVFRGDPATAIPADFASLKPKQKIYIERQRGVQASLYIIY